MLRGIFAVFNKNQIGRDIFTSPILQLCSTNSSCAVPENCSWSHLRWLRRFSSGPSIGSLQIQDLRSADLKGKDLITFDSFTARDIKTLLWVALDLKVSKDSQNICAGKRVFCIYDDPMTNLAVTNAASRAGAVSVSIPAIDIQPNLDLELFGRSISSCADIIFMESKNWSEKDIEKLSVGSHAPVVNLRSNMYAPGMALAECMSLQEHYEFLRRLTVSYIGPSTNPLLNTYQSIFPKLGIHFRYLIDGKMNEEVFARGLKLAQQFNTELHHCDNLADVIDRTHTITTCSHNLNDLFLTIRDIREADLDWTLFHYEIYKSATVSSDMLQSKQSLVWTAIENMSWIIQAWIVAGTQSYEPNLRRPVFEGIP